MRSFGAWVLVGCLLVACGGDDDGVAIEEVPAAYAEAACGSFERCLGPLAGVLFGGDCTTELTRRSEQGGLPLWHEAIADGRLEYDGKAARRCVDALEAATCESFSLTNAECDAVFVGSAAVGAPCSFGDECASGAYCDLDASCPGVCRALVGAGGTCDRDEACSGDLACEGTCVSPAGAGAPCDEDAGDRCRDGLLCLGGTCGTIAEALTLAVGATCDPEAGALCREGLSCVLDEFVVATETLVWRCVSPSPSGGSCKIGFPDPCPDSERCDADPETTGSLDGTCIPLPGAGEECEGGDFTAACAPGLQCIDGTCGALANLGATCGSAAGCYSGACEGGVCVTPECEG